MSTTLIASPEGSADERFEAQLKQYVNELMRVMAAVADVDEEGDGGAQRQTERVVDQLDTLQTTFCELDDLKDDLCLSIPISLIEHIDEGLNPDTVLRDWTQTLSEKNQRNAGQLQALRTFHTAMGSALPSCQKRKPILPQQESSLPWASMPASPARTLSMPVANVLTPPPGGVDAETGVKMKVEDESQDDIVMR
ncbi:hypothetical protein DFJ77DRAFT_466585 [Powellomyces hirtus]|nr:hypothetical protein DFJ77DRAFT_466585 [Powellomyces hirtus]